MLKLEYKDYTLNFKFDAGTSRGVLRKHQIFLLKVYDSTYPVVYGLGEAAPLTGLSPESLEDVMDELKLLQRRINEYEMPADKEAVFDMVRKMIPQNVPSLKFALETALLDLFNGGKRQIYDNGFCRGEQKILINGLVWMGNVQSMKAQIDDKLAQGFRCIKLKVGAIDFEEELQLLRYIRDKSQDVVIRLDANGAFKNNEAFKKLTELKELGIHSIEQPIRPGQFEAMQLICKRTPVPVAFDEELVGVYDKTEKHELLKFLRPHYVVLKPTLLGGFGETLEWIELAESQDIGWWITSALESNIGLNAISQFTGEFEDLSYQGLGTGQLYTNNFSSPLEVKGGYIGYDIKRSWESPPF